MCVYICVCMYKLLLSPLVDRSAERHKGSLEFCTYSCSLLSVKKGGVR